MFSVNYGADLYIEAEKPNVASFHLDQFGPYMIQTFLLYVDEALSTVFFKTIEMQISLVKCKSCHSKLVPTNHQQ